MQLAKLAVLGLILTCSSLALAQTGSKPDQVKLMKQFEGKWVCEQGQDTMIVCENTTFGNGLVSDANIISNGKIINSVKQLYGYDQVKDVFIIAELMESSPSVEICNAWFISDHIGEMIVVNPVKSGLKYKFEFKTPDLIVQTAIANGKVVKKITLNRVKNVTK